LSQNEKFWYSDAHFKEFHMHTKQSVSPVGQLLGGMPPIKLFGTHVPVPPQFTPMTAGETTVG